MKVLIVGQLPKEMGGHYTTGIARVIGELSKHHFGDADVVVYGTNISNKKAIKLNVDANQACVFAGYKINPLGLLVHAIRHPKMTIKALIDYKVHGGASMLHLEFFRYNFSNLWQFWNIDFMLVTLLTSQPDKSNEVKPDLIHYHGSGFIAMYHANKKYGVPILLTLHGLMWSGIDSDDPKEIEWKRSSELILPLAKRYTTLNENALKKMLKLGVKREQVDIIPNGVDSDKFYYSEDVRKEFRKKFSVDEIITLNFSLLKDLFDCPYKFKMTNVFGFCSPLNIRMGYGRSIHNMLDYIHRNYEKIDYNDPKIIERIVKKYLH